MSDREDSGGCCGVILLLMFIPAMVEYSLRILMASVVLVVVAAVAAGVWRAASSAVARAAERRTCPVCGSWSGSVMLTELDEAATATLCTKHRLRLQRLTALEQELRLDE